MGARIASRLSLVAQNAASKWSHNSHTITKLSWKIIFPVQLAVIIYITLKLTTVLLGGGATYEEFHNTYCLETSDPSIMGPKLNGSFSGDCVYDYKFTKVITKKKLCTIVLYLYCSGVVSLVRRNKLGHCRPNIR
jgi:hypothetical protein